MKKTTFLLTLLLATVCVNYSYAGENTVTVTKTNIYGGKWSKTLFADASVVDNGSYSR